MVCLFFTEVVGGSCGNALIYELSLSFWLFLLEDRDVLFEKPLFLRDVGLEELAFLLFGLKLLELGDVILV